MTINDYNLFDNKRLIYDNITSINLSDLHQYVKNFESIDSFFSISGVTYTVSIFNYAVDIERIETPMKWQEIALKVTVWFLSVITLIPFIAIIIIKHIYHQSINHILMGGPDCLQSLNEAIPYLEKSDLLTRENHAALIKCRNHIYSVSKGISHLYESNLLTQPNFDKLVAEAQWAQRAVRAFYPCLIESLREENLLTQPNFDLIYSLEPSESYFFSQNLLRLNNRNLLTQANIDALVQNREHLKDIASGLRKLDRAYLLTQANFNALVQNREHSTEILKGLYKLEEFHLLTQTNFDELLQNPEGAYNKSALIFIKEIARRFRDSPEVDLTQDNFDALLQNPEQFKGIANGLFMLRAVNLLTLDNFIAILQNQEHSTKIASGLRKLNRAHLLTQANFNALVQNREHSAKILKGLDKLEEFHLLTQTNFNALLQNPEDAYYKSAVIFIKEIARRFRDLAGVDLTQTNFDALLQNPEQLIGIANEFFILMEFNLLTLDNFIAILQNQEHSTEIVNGLRELAVLGLLTQANFDVLLQHPERAYDHALEIVREAEVYLNMTGTVNVHTRDARCRAAMELLIEAQQENISQHNISQGLRDFRAFLDRRPQSTQKEKALRALIGTQQENMPPFLGPQDMWSVRGLVLTGEEVIGRLWCFANTLQEPDQTNVKMGMIKALDESIENHHRICNPGKVSHLLHSALQGYLPGVNLDPETEEEAPISANQGAIMFFNANQTNLLNETINTRELLNAQGNVWLEENPRVTDREGFFRQLEEYANAENWP